MIMLLRKARVGSRPFFVLAVAFAVLVALVAAVLTVAAPQRAGAQDNLPPVAVASTRDRAACPSAERILLDQSFDVDDTIVSRVWEVVTRSYSWLAIRGSDGCSNSNNAPHDGKAKHAEYTKPTVAQIAAYGDSITFRLTVTDNKGASDSATVTDNYGAPTAPSATLTLTSGGLIDGPGENGNEDNEYDVAEGSDIVLDASGSSAGITNADWEVLYPDGLAAPVKASDPKKPFTAKAKVGNAPSGRAAYIYYKATVTSGTALTGVAVVKVVVQPTPPKIDSITVTGADNADVANPDPLSGMSDRYVIAPGATAQLTVAATGTGSDTTDAPSSYAWTGDVDPEDTKDESTSVTAPAGAEEGSQLTATVTVTDGQRLSTQRTITFTVANNQPPTATVLDLSAPASREKPYYGPLEVGDGSMAKDNMIEAIYNDANGDPLNVVWTELHQTRTGPAGEDAILSLNVDNTGTTSTVSFDVPEFARGSEPPYATSLILVLAVIDRWGTFALHQVKVRITHDDDAPVANAGDDQVVMAGSRVRLDGSGSHDPDGQPVGVGWDYVGISVEPNNRGPLTAAEIAQGFCDATCQAGDDGQVGWLPDMGNVLQETAGRRLRGANTAYPYFDAPELSGFRSVKLTFRVAVTSGEGEDEITTTDMVTITVVGDYYSGIITHPTFCSNRSLGGPMTYPHDSDGDGVADVCSLDTTRRAAVARQNALESLATLNPTAFKEAVAEACKGAPKTLGDTEAQLKADACSTDRVSPPPGPVAEAAAAQFFSGIIDGPNFCRNRSLGGPMTYPHDSDGDGVADVCALPYTRREAVARQAALSDASYVKTDGEYSEQYKAALAAACASLGTTDFGDAAADLQQDLCIRPAPGVPGINIIEGTPGSSDDPNVVPPNPPETPEQAGGGDQIAPNPGTQPTATATTRARCNGSEEVLIGRPDVAGYKYRWTVEGTTVQAGNIEIRESNGCDNNDPPQDDVSTRHAEFAWPENAQDGDTVTLTLTVTDDNGATGTDTVTATYTAP